MMIFFRRPGPSAPDPDQGASPPGPPQAAPPEYSFTRGAAPPEPPLFSEHVLFSCTAGFSHGIKLTFIKTNKMFLQSSTLRSYIVWA